MILREIPIYGERVDPLVQDFSNLLCIWTGCGFYSEDSDLGIWGAQNSVFRDSGDADEVGPWALALSKASLESPEGELDQQCPVDMVDGFFHITPCTYEKIYEEAVEEQNNVTFW